MFRVLVEVTPPQKVPDTIVGNITVSSKPFLLDEYKFITEENNKMSSNSPNQSRSQSEIVFFAGNPTVDSIKGIFHLCKDADPRLINLANGDDKNITEIWDTSIPVVFLYFLISVSR